MNLSIRQIDLSKGSSSASWASNEKLRDHLDKNDVRTLFENYDEVLEIVQKKQIAPRKYYQDTFVKFE